MSAKNSAAYESAIEAHNDAQDIYKPIAAAYLAGTVSDEDYMAAHLAYDAANKAFDVAYATAQNA